MDLILAPPADAPDVGRSTLGRSTTTRSIVGRSIVGRPAAPTGPAPPVVPASQPQGAPLVPPRWATPPFWG
ncbi:hypothetical protein [Brachybacterium aquaticum]|uniref:Uncharacterized protein n=1 Tax=Brachybacterium aquaticum TaxID=1432564 RepID=A0A841AE91_9MICO|nr:hypothetical protein [Brachybacterium aquaticum]MBB5831464.1 hypothetical protein [Brachybacterium aquaticum]